MGLRDYSVIKPAEEEGFEPPELALGGFQDRCLRPLGHSSREALKQRGQYRDRQSLVKRDQVILSKPPTYGRSAAGTITEPSACWYCSRIATSVRPIAMPDPFSVWTGRGFSPAAVR